MNLPFHYDAYQKIFENARFLKKVMTPAEELLWQQLRGRRFKGHKFRRQHPLKSFIADFYCHSAKLVIEIDGGYHNTHEAKNYDKIRKDALRELGISVIRFTNYQVLSDLNSVLKEIEMNLNNLPKVPLS